MNRARVFEIARSILQKLGLSLFLSFPIAVYVSGGARLSEQSLDSQSCLTRKEFNFLGIVAFRVDSYHKECSEAQAILAIMQGAAYTTPPDPGMIAVAIRAWANKYPRVNELVETINEQLLSNPDSSAVHPLQPSLSPPDQK